MILSKLGNKNYALLGRMLDLTAASHRVHAQNIANVNTPFYKTRKLSFEGSLKEAMSRGTAEDYMEIEAHIDRPRNTLVRNNGNNVDLDKEMLQDQEVSKMFEILTTAWNLKSNLTDMAIREGK